VAAGRADPTGVLGTGSVGEPAQAGSAGVAGPIEPNHRELTEAVQQEVEKCPEAQRLMTHPGVGPLTALAFALVIGTAERFRRGKQIASYLGLVPSEESSGERRRLGHISKQGNSLHRTGGQTCAPKALSDAAFRMHALAIYLDSSCFEHRLAPLTKLWAWS